jgi:hypothetical protein
MIGRVGPWAYVELLAARNVVSTLVMSGFVDWRTLDFANRSAFGHAAFGPK